MKYITREFPERYYIGVEYEGGITPGKPNKIGDLWSVFFNEDMKLLNGVELIDEYIGLECYPPDFKETRQLDYYAMAQTKELVKIDGFSSKKLPEGKYISFEVQFDNLYNEIQQVFNYMKENDINAHMGFDFEEYINGQDYMKDGAILYFSLLLEDD